MTSVAEMNSEKLEYSRDVSKDLLKWCIERYQKTKQVEFKLSECKENFKTITECYLIKACEILRDENSLTIDDKSRIPKYSLIPSPSFMEKKTSLGVQEKKKPIEKKRKIEESEENDENYFREQPSMKKAVPCPRQVEKVLLPKREISNVHKEKVLEMDKPLPVEKKKKEEIKSEAVKEAKTEPRENITEKVQANKPAERKINEKENSSKVSDELMQKIFRRDENISKISSLLNAEFRMGSEGEDEGKEIKVAGESGDEGLDRQKFIAKAVKKFEGMAEGEVAKVLDHLETQGLIYSIEDLLFRA